MLDDGADLAYRPHGDDGWSWLAQLKPYSVLVVGRCTDLDAKRLESIAVGDTRTVDSLTASRLLHDGVYLADIDGTVHGVLVYDARPETEATHGKYRTDDSHLGSARDLFTDHWANARQFLGSAPIAAGDLVRPLSQKVIGRVRRVTRQDSRHLVEVELKDTIQSFDADDLEVVIGDPSSPEFWLSREPATADDIAMLLTWLKLNYPLTDMLYSYAATKTTFQPYQFIPALKILTSSTGRLLIADEVGLGKTIEAGLIWTELEQRAPIRRGLVVVPASLQVKWKQEMERRFMRPLPILKASDMREFAQQLRDDQDPDLLGIISIEALRGAPELLADLAELNPHFDFAIVDEAHVLRNRSSRSYHVGNLLSDWADYLVFLSATPLNLGSEDLFNLVNLLDEGGFPDREIFEGQLEPNRALNAIARNVSSVTTRSRQIARLELESIPAMEHGEAISRRPDFRRLRETLSGNRPIEHGEVAAIKRMVAELNTLGGVLSRTRKVDVPNRKAIRIAEQIDVKWTEQERAFYDGIHEHYRQLALSRNLPLGFAMQMPLRQASSCIPVAQERLWQKESWTSSDDDVGYDFWEEDAEAVDDWHGTNTSALATRITHDSKFDALYERLKIARANGMTQVLIFSFFKGTVEYLARRLGSEFSARLLHGGVPMEDREAIIQSFRRGDFDILVANQVGSEGLDFEFCNVLVNYDLPWNPMQVEQRIGRLDRFGQKFEKIFIFNMHVPGTIESDIIERLYNRIGVFERSIGDLEPIMRDTMREINERVLDVRLTPAQMAAEIDRLAVATERRKDDLSQLEESSGVLTTVSQLDVDGMTPDGPTSGRYIGSSELERLLRFLVDKYGGSLSDGARENLFTFRGTQSLSIALREVPRTDRGTMIGFGKLAGQLRDSIPIIIATSPEVAQDLNCELITARHPLIRLATHQLGLEPHRLQRFGSVRLKSSDVGGRKYLARIDIVRSSGVRDLCELWVTAIDVEKGLRNEDVEDQLMVELAEGTLATDTTSVPPALSALSRELERIVSQRQAHVRLERGQDNSALVDARISSELNSVSIKLDRAQDQLIRHRSERSESSLSRMFEGRIRNLTQNKEEIRSRYEDKRHLTLSVELAATIVVHA
ncbi:DEAD/DEAH box helicase [Homoserinimonas sp. A447]